jgi:uncharacterized protein YlaI
MGKKFQRTIENFICENCGATVVGDGYTDHCPFCLWGRHVDINPGDRAADCGGPMEPAAVSYKKKEIRIEYQCQKCEHRFTVKMAKNDNMDAVIELGAKQ